MFGRLVMYYYMQFVVQFTIFSKSSIDLFNSHLRNRKQLVQIDNIRSSFEVIKTGVPQGSQLGPLMFFIIYK